MGKRGWKETIPWNNTTAGIILAAVAPFALCAVGGLYHGHSSCALMIFYWLVTITGLLAWRKIKALGRRYALSVSREFIIYKEPFRSRLVNIADLLSVQTARDNRVILQTLSATIIVPCSVFASAAEAADIKRALKRFAPQTCRFDLSDAAECSR